VDAPSLVVTKSDSLDVDNNGNGLVDEGDTIGYTVTIVNNGLADALSTVFNDSPDSNTSLLNGSVATSSGTVTLGNTLGDTSVSVTIGTIASGGGSVTITYQVTVNTGLPSSVKSVANSALLSGSNFPDVPSNDPASGASGDPTRTLINQPAGSTLSPVTNPNPLVMVFDPAISKIGFLLPGNLGLQNEQIEWFFTVTNIGNATGFNIIVTDVLRPELRIDQLKVAAPLVGTVSGQTITVLIPSLAPGQSVTFSLVTTVISGGSTIDNTACLNAPGLAAERCVTSQPISSLPSTGESPIWWPWIMLAVLAAVSTVMGVVARNWLIRRRQQ
jgi:uncharacterized repeat protein (TIGR01451 family)